jgi:enoyl-CoA hydratase/carnithine racemase
MSDPVVVTDEGGVRIVRMNRPEKKNALTAAMYAAMTQALREADTSDAIRCVMIAGAPGAFCAGNDIGDFLAAAMGGGLDTHATDFLRALAQGRTPLVAAVGGAAIGIGTTMLFHCDHVVAAADATLSTPFLKLALIPEAASTLLAPQRMGHARAFSLLAMGRPLTAAEAKDAGIVNTVVEPGALDAAALQAAQEIAALPPGALATTRELMRGNTDEVTARIDAEVAHFAKLLQSDEARAAFQAFMARKK